MSSTPRERFLAGVRSQGARPVVSPFLPHADVVAGSLRLLGLPASGDAVQDEIQLSRALDYEPMFMTECPGLIFPWQLDEAASDAETDVYTLPTVRGTWVRRVSHALGLWGDESGFPVRTQEDHEMLVAACADIGNRAVDIRRYLREWRTRVGEGGVIVLGHPHPSWLGYQIAQQNIFLHWLDDERTYRRSMAAVFEASLLVMQIAIQEGIDFMSDGAYGLEMTSPDLFDRMDMPLQQEYSYWTHAHGGLFWHHNCGHTRRLILSGRFNLMGLDVLETVAPPPAGDNDLAESRRALDPAITTKGNLDLGLLRDGTVEQVRAATRAMVEAVRGYKHIFSTADAVLPGTPPENFVAFVKTVREAP